MKIKDANEWVSSFIAEDDKHDRELINNCSGYAELLHEIDSNFYISENDANAIIEFMHNKGMKLYRNINDVNTTSPL